MHVGENARVSSFPEKQGQIISNGQGKG